jgi:hypothetical protein
VIHRRPIHHVDGVDRQRVIAALHRDLDLDRPPWRRGHCLLIPVGSVLQSYPRRWADGLLYALFHVGYGPERRCSCSLGLVYGVAY